LNLRVNYGHDWVESFYEAGHTVWITVKDSEGNVKATAEVVTQAREEWQGEEGFQTRPEDWNPDPPNIQPDDWVYGFTDNGAGGQVQIGEIRGVIDPGADSITGTIYVQGLPVDLNIECHSWGAPQPTENKSDTVRSDGSDMYSCSWSGDWNIQPGQEVGVGYFGAEGHWVATGFTIASPSVGDFSVTVLEQTCPTYVPETDVEGFISKSDDPLMILSGTSVHFQGTNECADREMHGAASLIYRYRLEFQEFVRLSSIVVSGAAFNGPDNILRVLDSNMSVLESIDTSGGNSFKTHVLTLKDVRGRTFFVDEYDTSGDWRYRESILVIVSR
jgi:hypothetical protein